MLIFSETRYNPVSVNMITLKNDHGYFHVHRSLYDSAVILHDLYANNQASLRSMIMPTVSRPEVNYFLENVPAPINILGYFLELINGTESLGEDLETLCGAIHVMSMSLDFRNLLKVDMKLRQSIRFSLSIKEEYQIQWDRFFAESTPYGQPTPMYDVPQQRVAYGQPQQPYTVYGVPQSVEEEEEETEVAENEFLFEDEPEDFAALAAEFLAKAEGEQEEEEEEKKEETPAPTAPEPEPVPEPVKASDSGLDLVKGWV